MSRRFAKYEGLGNDFIVLDASSWPELEVTPDLATLLCDRHRGIGGDGVLWVERRADASVRMVILNADGSRPEMCGNGVRCVGAYLGDMGERAVGDTIELVSDAGHRPLVLHAAHDGAWQVEVDMGVARVSPDVPVVGDGVRVHCVDMGNPHGVMFDPRGDDMELARAVRGLGAFPQGVNVEFVTMEGGGLRVRVHERGVGWTQACGTGACAVVAAAVREGMARAGETVDVTLDGGPLTVWVEPETWRVRMMGPARRVFAGRVS